MNETQIEDDDWATTAASLANAQVVKDACSAAGAATWGSRAQMITRLISLQDTKAKSASSSDKKEKKKQ